MTAPMFGHRYTAIPDSGVVELHCGTHNPPATWDAGYHPSLDVLIDQARAHDVAEHDNDSGAGDDPAAEIMRLRGALERYGRITTAWTRGMYCARIDCTRGDVKAAIECLSEGLDGYDGTEWDGTETGAEWWERTKAEEGL